MTAAQIVEVAAVFVAASVLSAVAGFGFGLMSVPLMSLAVDVRQAVVLSTMVGLGVTTIQAVQWRRHADRGVLRRTVLAAYLGMPFGYWLFVHVEARWLKLALGVAVLAAVVLLVRRIDLRDAGPGLDYAAGLVSGVLNTSLSTNGPPLAFALQAKGMEPNAFRGTISAIFLSCNVASFALFASRGYVTRSALVTVLVALPAVVVGLLLGGRLRPHVDAKRFRALVLALLTVAGIMAIATA